MALLVVDGEHGLAALGALASVSSEAVPHVHQVVMRRLVLLAYPALRVERRAPTLGRNEELPVRRYDRHEHGARDNYLRRQNGVRRHERWQGFFLARSHLNQSLAKCANPGLDGPQVLLDERKP